MSAPPFGFPAAVKELFEDVSRDVSFLHAKWKTYKQFFHNAGHVAIINEMVPGVFQLLEESLRDDMTMSFGRLLDPPTSLGKPNLSIEQLVHVACTHADAEKQTNWPIWFQAIKHSCADILALRNRRVAHNDLNTALGVNPRPSITGSDVEPVLELMRVLIVDILYYFERKTAGFELFMLGDGDDLLMYLKEAWEHRKEKQRAMIANIQSYTESASDPSTEHTAGPA